jgi:hypothetical protein
MVPRRELRTWVVPAVAGALSFGALEIVNYFSPPAAWILGGVGLLALLIRLAVLRWRKR